MHVEPNRYEIGLLLRSCAGCDGGTPPAVGLASRAIPHCPIRFSLATTESQSENDDVCCGRRWISARRLGAGAAGGRSSWRRRAVMTGATAEDRPRAPQGPWRGRGDASECSRRRFATLAEPASAERISRSYVCRVLRLRLLAPDIVERILDGRPTAGLAQCLKPVPVEWERQREQLLQ